MREKIVLQWTNQTGLTTGTHYSDSQELIHIFGYAVCAMWTEEVASLAGTISLEASIDGTNWAEITGSPEAVSGTGSKLWNVSEAMYRYIRLKLVITGGTAGLTADINIKGV